MFSLISFSQSDTENDKVPIKANPNPPSEFAVQAKISMQISLISLIENLSLYELKGYPDTLKTVLDSAKITLKKGTSWNPLKDPPESKFIVFKVIFNKLDSVAMDRINYLEFMSNYEDRKDIPYEMVDTLFFSNSYYANNNEIIMKINFICLPNIEKAKFELTHREIVYMKE